jgi:hypothetical protein
MTADEFERSVMQPGIAFMQQHAPGVRWQRNAHVLALAIAGQESDWTARVQAGNGPAHSFWQFERGGGVRALIHHPRTGPILKSLCGAAAVAFEERAIWDIMARPEGDNLAVCMARLLLFTDPAAIPPPSDGNATWDYYERNWRPGAPRPQAWPNRLAAADQAVAAEPTG